MCWRLFVWKLTGPAWLVLSLRPLPYVLFVSILTFLQGEVWLAKIAVSEQRAKDKELPRDADGKIASAIKVVLDGATDLQKIDFAQEAVTTNQFKHQHVVRLLFVSGGVVLGGGPLQIALELSSDGSLSTLLATQKLSWSDIFRAMVDTADGMLYLAHTGFVHRDLATRNIFVGNGVCKVGDFGLSRKLGSVGFGTKKVPLPIRWTAPEVLKEGDWTQKSDVWYVLYTFCNFINAPHLHVHVPFCDFIQWMNPPASRKLQKHFGYKECDGECPPLFFAFCMSHVIQAIDILNCTAFNVYIC